MGMGGPPGQPGQQQPGQSPAGGGIMQMGMHPGQMMGQSQHMHVSFERIVLLGCLMLVF